MTSECCSNHVSDSNGNVMVFSLSSFITKFLSFFVYNYFLLAARIRNGFLAQNFSLSHHFFLVPCAKIYFLAHYNVHSGSVITS
jgi:hypothetical protein